MAVAQGTKGCSGSQEGVNPGLYGHDSSGCQNCHSMQLPCSMSKFGSLARWKPSQGPPMVCNSKLSVQKLAACPFVPCVALGCHGTDVADHTVGQALRGRVEVGSLPKHSTVCRCAQSHGHKGTEVTWCCQTGADSASRIWVCILRQLFDASKRENLNPHAYATKPCMRSASRCRLNVTCWTCVQRTSCASTQSGGARARATRLGK